jgi:hypothetical protein
MENAILARDKVIHELRLRLPTTTILDSDKLISDIMTRPDDFSRLSVVRAAQSTIDSLQVDYINSYLSLNYFFYRLVLYKKKKVFVNIKKCLKKLEMI